MKLFQNIEQFFETLPSPSRHQRQKLRCIRGRKSVNPVRRLLYTVTAQRLELSDAWPHADMDWKPFPIRPSFPDCQFASPVWKCGFAYSWRRKKTPWEETQKRLESQPAMRRDFDSNRKERGRSKPPNRQKEAKDSSISASSSCSPGSLQDDNRLLL